MGARARKTLGMFTAVLVLGVPRARAADGGAKGTLTVNGRVTTIAYAYARASKGTFDKTKEDVEVILSDVPLEGRALEDPLTRIRMASAGKLHALEFLLDADAGPISTAFRHDGFKSASPDGISTDFVFTKDVFDGKTVAGRYACAKTREFFGETYTFDVSFAAAIAHARHVDLPTPSETAAARKSPQASVYASFLAAVQREDVVSLRRLLSREQAKRLDGPDAKKLVEMLKDLSATDVRVSRVTVTRDRAELVVSGTQWGSAAGGVVHMVKEDGEWKVERQEWKN